MNSSEKKLAIRSGAKIVFVPQSSILYCEKEGRNTIIHFEDGSSAILTKTSLITLFKVLDNTQFLITHPAIIINVNSVTMLDKDNSLTYYSILNNSIKVPVTSSKRRALLGMIGTNLVNGKITNLL